MAWCVPLPSPIPRCHMLREGRGKFSLSAGRYHSGESVRSPEFLQGTLFYGLTADSPSTVVRSWPGTIRRGRWGRGFGEFGSLGGDVTQPSPVRRRASAIRAIRCALSIRKILSARALRSASPAIATRQAAITILPKPAPLKAPGGKTTGVAGKSCRCRKALVAGQSGGFRGRRSTGIGRVGMRRCTLGSTAPERISGAWAITTPRQRPAKMTAPVIQYQYSAGWSAVRQRGELQHHLGQQWLYLAADVAVWRGADAAKSVLLGSARLWQPGRGCNSSASDYHGGFGNAQIGYRHDAASNQLTGRRRLGGRASARRHLRPDGG